MRALLGNAAPLTVARLAGAALTFAAPLVVARALSLDAFGTYKQLFILAQGLAFVLPLGMAQSLYYFLPRSPRPAPYVAQSALFLLAAGAVALAVVWAFLPVYAAWVGNPALSAHRGALAVYAFGVIASSSLEVVLVASGRVRRAATVYLVSDAARTVALVLPAVAGLGIRGIAAAMAGWAVLRVAASLVLAHGAGRPELDGRRLREQLAYALPFAGVVALSLPTRYAPELAVAASVAPAVYALYAAGTLQVPLVDLVYTPTGELLMVRLAELERAGRIAEAPAAFAEATTRLAYLLLPLSALLFATAPEVVTAIYGGKFAGAAPIFRIAVAAIPVYALPLDAALRARRRLRALWTAYALKAVVAVAAAVLLVQVLGLGPRGGACALLLAEWTGALLLLARIPSALRAGPRVPWRALLPWRPLRNAAVAAACGILAVELARGRLVHLPEGGAALSLAAASAVFAGVYLVALRTAGDRWPRLSEA